MLNNDGYWKPVAIGENDYDGSLYDDGYCLTYQLPHSLKKAKSIKVRLSSTSNDDYVNYDTEIDSFSIVYRERGNA